MQRLFDWKALADAKDYARLFSRILEESGVVRRELFLKESERELTNYLHVFELLLEEAGQSNAALQDLNRSLCAYIDGRCFEGQDGNVQRLESEKGRCPDHDDPQGQGGGRRWSSAALATEAGDQVKTSTRRPAFRYLGKNRRRRSRRRSIVKGKRTSASSMSLSRARRRGSTFRSSTGASRRSPARTRPSPPR
jgi:hypothetical protein